LIKIYQQTPRSILLIALTWPSFFKQIETLVRRPNEEEQNPEMSSTSDFIGYRQFASRQEIGSLVAQSESVTNLPRTLLIFSTSRQHTWLVATTKSLACVLDDVRREDPRIQWTMPIGEAAAAI
jgi:hypothetical protein